MLIPAPTWTPKLVLGLCFVVFILASLVTDRIGQWWRTREAVQASTTPMIEKMETATAIDIDGALASNARDAAQQLSTTAAGQFRADIARGRRNEPETRVRADRAVPVSVRNAFRARRLALDRSGCAGAECGTTATQPDPAER